MFKINVYGEKDFVTNIIKTTKFVDKKFAPKLTLELAREGRDAIRQRLKPHRWRGNKLVSGVTARRVSGGGATIDITGDAVWFEKGVRLHPVSLRKPKNAPIRLWAESKGLATKPNGRPKRSIWVHTPRLGLSHMAEKKIRQTAPDAGRKVWRSNLY